MRRVDHALPWGRELEFGEDPINDRRLEFMRDQLHARISRAQPTFRVKTPKSFGMPHLQFNAKKRQMELDQALRFLPYFCFQVTSVCTCTACHRQSKQMKCFR